MRVMTITYYNLTRNLHPLQVVVVMCGTNNHGDSAADIAEGIKAICSLIRDKQPQAYLVVLVRMD